MEGEWPCYRGGQFNAGRMVMLQKVTEIVMVPLMENGHVTQVVSMVMLQRSV